MRPQEVQQGHLDTMSKEFRNILVVDDNEDLLLAIRLFLRDHADTVDVEADPRNIPSRMMKKAYDVILLDMNFTLDTTSGREGFHWLQKILELDSQAVVVLITGYGDVDTAVEAVKGGATDFVLKPFTNEKLLSVCLKASAQGRHGSASALRSRGLEHEMETARKVQNRLYPQNLPVVDRLDYAAVCRPAQGAGGDYYDFLSIRPSGLGIAVGDVSGKGVSAALLMANLQGRLQSFAPLRERALDHLFVDLNDSMCLATESSRYATFFYGVFDPLRCSLTYVNAGHHPPLLFRSVAQREPDRLTIGGMVLGLFPNSEYEQDTVLLAGGEVLIAFTDGLVEALNLQGQDFGEDRLIESASRRLSLPASGICEGILEDLATFCDGNPPRDDLTLVVARVLPAPSRD